MHQIQQRASHRRVLNMHIYTLNRAQATPDALCEIMRVLLQGTGLQVNMDMKIELSKS